MMVWNSCTQICVAPVSQFLNKTKFGNSKILIAPHVLTQFKGTARTHPPPPNKFCMSEKKNGNTTRKNRIWIKITMVACAHTTTNHHMP